MVTTRIDTIDTSWPSNGTGLSCDPGLSRLRPIEQHQMQAMSRRLTEEFAPGATAPVVERIIGDLLRTILAEAKFTTYVPILTERQAREALRALVGLSRPEIVA